MRIWLVLMIFFWTRLALLNFDWRHIRLKGIVLINYISCVLRLEVFYFEIKYLLAIPHILAKNIILAVFDWFIFKRFKSHSLDTIFEVAGLPQVSGLLRVVIYKWASVDDWSCSSIYTYWGYDVIRLVKTRVLALLNFFLGVSRDLVILSIVWTFLIWCVSADLISYCSLYLS